MTWQQYLKAGWRNLPGGMRRFLITAVLGALGLVVLAFILPVEWQLLPLLALFGLFVVVQGVVLWMLWRQGPAFRRARRAYLAGDFAEAVRILEERQETDALDAAEQTLLGNTYRQMGRLLESERILRKAFEAAPDEPFPAYGLGRTLLALGQYEEAAALITRALSRGADVVILADLGHAQYRAGLVEDAEQTLEEAGRLTLDPPRALMTRYLLWRLSGQPVDQTLVARLERYDHGLDFWRAEAARFHDSPYGDALTEDIAGIERVLAQGRHDE